MMRDPTVRMSPAVDDDLDALVDSLQVVIRRIVITKTGRSLSYSAGQFILLGKFPWEDVMTSENAS